MQTLERAYTNFVYIQICIHTYKKEKKSLYTYVYKVFIRHIQSLYTYIYKVCICMYTKYTNFIYVNIHSLCTYI